MGWFTRKPDPMTIRSHELNTEIAALEVKIHQIKNASNYSNPHQIQTVFDETCSMPAYPFLKTEEELEESIPAEPERDSPSLYNDMGLRKFKRAVEKAGIVTEIKKREFYEKPTAVRKRKAAAAVKREQKVQRKNRLNRPPRF